MRSDRERLEDILGAIVFQSPTSYYKLLKEARISWQKAQKKNPRQDPEAVKERLKEIKSILAEAMPEIKAEKVVVYAIDEVHLLEGDLISHLWGDSKERLNIPMMNEKNRQTYYGALNLSKEATLEWLEGLGYTPLHAADEMKLVIVWDMWLTGFDALCLHTIYVDKPMRGHGLMQAIARVNRVFKDKPGGLVFAAVGLKNPDISILSDEFLEDVRGLPYRNLALEVLRKLINDEIKTRCSLRSSASLSQAN
nr:MULTISPECIES: type I restriction enzyme endonuclease domain-containing protein [unclassified Coleofasciculus]